MALVRSFRTEMALLLKAPRLPLKDTLLDSLYRFSALKLPESTSVEYTRVSEELHSILQFIRKVEDYQPKQTKEHYAAYGNPLLGTLRMREDAKGGPIHSITIRQN